MPRGRKKQDPQEIQETTPVEPTNEQETVEPATTPEKQENTTVDITFTCNLLHNGAEYLKDSTHTMSKEDAEYFIQSNYATYGIHS